MNINFDEIINLLDEHIKILKKHNLSDKDIKFLLTTSEQILILQKYINELKNIDNLSRWQMEKLQSINNKIKRIIKLTDIHKQKILENLSKYQNKKKAFYNYTIENPNIKSFSKKV